MIWNIKMDKLKETLKKNKIEFKEVQGKIIIGQKRQELRVLYKPLEITIDGSIYKCLFYKCIIMQIPVTKEFVYMNSLIKYIKKYLKGEL